MCLTIAKDIAAGLRAIPGAKFRCERVCDSACVRVLNRKIQVRVLNFGVNLAFVCRVSVAYWLSSVWVVEREFDLADPGVNAAIVEEVRWLIAFEDRTREYSKGRSRHFVENQSAKELANRAYGLELQCF